MTYFTNFYHDLIKMSPRDTSQQSALTAAGSSLDVFNSYRLLRAKWPTFRRSFRLTFMPSRVPFRFTFTVSCPAFSAFPYV